MNVSKPVCIFLALALTTIGLVTGSIACTSLGAIWLIVFCCADFDFEDVEDEPKIKVNKP